MCVKIREFQCIYIYTSAASISPTTHSHISMRIHSLPHYANIFLVLLSQPLLLLLMILLLNALGFQNDYFAFGCNAKPMHVVVRLSSGWQCV